MNAGSDGVEVRKPEHRRPSCFGPLLVTAPALLVLRRLVRPVPLGIGLVVLALGLFAVAPRPTVAGFLGLLVVAGCLTVLARIAVHGPFAPVAITFWAFVCIWVGFAPLLQLRAGRLPWADTPLAELYPMAQLVLLAALIAFYFGYSTGGGTEAGSGTEPTAGRGIGSGHSWLRLSVTGAVAVTAATTVLAAVALPFTGGLLVRFTTRDGLRSAMENAGLVSGDDRALAGILSTLPAAASLASLVMCLLCLRGRAYSSRRSRLLLIAATVVAAIVNVIFNNPLSATRFMSFSVLLAIVLCLVDLRSLRRRLLFTGAMVGGLALVYPLANLFRNQSSRSRLRLGLDAYYTFDFDGFQQTVNTVYYVDAHGHTWGHHTISALLFWVPRSIWEGKALPAGIAVADARGYDFQNLALPLWAEMYLEYSWIGVALLMFCFGLVARRLDLVIQRQVTSGAAVVATLFAALQIGLLRGPIGAQIPFAAAAVVIALVGTRLRWSRTRQPAPAEGGLRARTEL